MRFSEMHVLHIIYFPKKVGALLLRYYHSRLSRGDSKATQNSGSQGAPSDQTSAQENHAISISNDLIPITINHQERVAEPAKYHL